LQQYEVFVSKPEQQKISKAATGFAVQVSDTTMLKRDILLIHKWFLCDFRGSRKNYKRSFSLKAQKSRKFFI